MSAFNFNLTSLDVGTKAEEQKPIVVTMELEEHNPRFMSRFQRYEPKIKDSTARKLFKECPRKYFYNIVLGFTPNDKAVVLEWGSAYHIFREVLEKTYGIGVHEKYNKDAATNAFVEAAMKAQSYWVKNGVHLPTIGTKFEFMTTQRFLQTLKTAFNYWEAEKLNGKIVVVASEQAFNVQIADGSWIGGRADQMVRWNGILWGRDFKTTTKDSAFFARQLEPSDQFTGYTLADTKLSGEFVQGQLVELMYNANPTKKDPKGPQVIPLTTSRTPKQLEVFEKELVFTNKQMQMCRDEDIWPMHEASCGFCPFHSVCKKPTEDGQMAQLEQDYSIRPWDFSKVGGDDD